MKPAQTGSIVVPRHHGAVFFALARIGCPNEGSVMADSLDETIRTNATGPSKASGDSGSMEQHPLPDQIAADRYLESKKAARGKGLGVGLRKLVPPGTD
jgi:hypothetical protein